MIPIISDEVYEELVSSPNKKMPAMNKKVNNTGKLVCESSFY